MTDQLTPIDATFLELEEADQGAHMHIGGIMVFEPQPGGGAPRLSRVRKHLETRLGELPRYRQRLSQTHTGGLSWPSWADHSDFDISGHVRRASLPGRGTEAELRDWAGEFFSERLDRTRPLWETVVVEGLSGGRWALATKTHHCMVDGVGSVDVALLMLDAERHLAGRRSHADASSASASDPDTEPGGTSRHVLGLPLRAAAASARGLRRGLGAATHPERAREALHRSRAMAEVLVRDELIAAPDSSINGPIGGKRRLGVTSAPLAEIKQVKGSFGGTVNDVVLAVTAGGLRRLLVSRGDKLPAQGLRAMVPMNIRAASERLALGNKISSLFVHLPVDEADPRRRYARQVEEAESLKSGSQALGSSTLVELTGLAPPVAHSFLARSLFATRLFNLTITNVPGPQQPLYAFGSKMLAVWPLVPLAADHALALAVFSYDGMLFFAVNADYDAVPDLDVLVAGICDSIAELAEAALDLD